jgi:hypothetical protein
MPVAHMSNPKLSAKKRLCLPSLYQVFKLVNLDSERENQQWESNQRGSH